MNSITLVGNLTADPDLTYTSTTGKAVAKMTVACDRSRMQDSKTDYILCESWETLAETVNADFRKGHFVKVTGVLHIDAYEKDGVKRTIAKVIAKKVERVERSADDEGAA